MYDTAELYRLATHGATLLVPNLRVARQLRSQLIDRCADRDDAAQLSERVLHWRGWTHALWRAALLQGRDERVLLSAIQERLLWEQILARSGQELSTEAVLDLCSSAANLLYQYNAAQALSHMHTSGAEDHDRFASWFRAFEERCHTELLLPAAALESALATHAAVVPVTSTLVLCELKERTPAQEFLLNALRRQGTTVLAAPEVDLPPAKPVLLCCADSVAELNALTERLAAVLQAAHRPSVAVVVPDLSSTRDQLDRALRGRLEPGGGVRAGNDRRPLWEFSTGRPLASTAVVADALQLLTWSDQAIGAEEISLLLRSPYLKWPMDAETAASIDAALLRRHPDLRGTWHPNGVARILQKTSPILHDTLRTRTRNWSALRGSSGSFSSFADRARRTLRDFGWPNSGTTTSTDFQAVTRFEGLLDGIAMLDIVGGEPPSWALFLQRLGSAARRTSFLRENTGAPIQILTPGESTGMEASELWFLHADEEHWRVSTATSPLLPVSLQQRFGMPGTDAVLEAAKVRDHTERIARVARDVTFSFAQSSEAGEQRPASAVTALASLTAQRAQTAGTLATLQASSSLETFAEDTAVPLLLQEDEHSVAGGVSLLQSQAACPFRAFAERRLGSAALDDHDLGMDARARGSFLHAALQIFWNDVGNSVALKQLIERGRLADAIGHSVARALSTRRDQADRWTDSYLDIQRTRLESLLDRWLRREAERPDFKVAGLEKDAVVSVGPLRLKVRVDRVDQVTLPDGSQAHLILDYKTGSQKAGKWEGDRPDEPQLPLYATSATAILNHGEAMPVEAIAFAVVRPGKDMSFISEPRTSELLVTNPRSVDDTFEGKLESWRNTLQSLAEDFAAGIASVNPKEYPATCRYCNQRLLCRLNPALLDAEDPNEVDA